MLSQYANPSYVLALLEGGSARRAYLLKERVNDLEQLVAAIRAVADGGSVIDPKVVEALVAENARGEESPLNELTPRERDVLREMAEGKNNAAIADALFLTERSVEKVIHSIFLKLGLTWETGGPQARQGRDPLPGGERLASSRQRERAGDAGAAAGLRTDRQPAAERLDAVAQPVETRIGAASVGRRASVDDLEDERSLLVSHRDRRARLRRRRARAPRDSTGRPCRATSGG